MAALVPVYIAGTLASQSTANGVPPTELTQGNVAAAPADGSAVAAAVTSGAVVHAQTSTSQGKTNSHN